MKKLTDEYTVRLINRQMNRQTWGFTDWRIYKQNGVHVWIDRLMVKQTSMNRQTDGLIDRWMNWQTDGWTDRLVGEQTDGWTE